ncbi:MAG TPA: zf-HC2 domain-containing protein [Anaerolineales bacterium]
MSAVSHHQARQWVEQAADGNLKPEQQRLLQQHLAECAACQAFAAELAALEASLRSTLNERWPASGLPTPKKKELIKEMQTQFSHGGGAPWTGLRWLLWLIPLLVILAWIFFQQTTPKPLDAAAIDTATASPNAPATSSPTATKTPTALSSSTPTQQVLTLIAIPVQNVNCRAGNSNAFDIEDTLLEAEEYKPNARGFDNLWARFVGPVNQVPCWAYVENLLFTINEEPVELVNVPESLLPFAAYPATPTPTVDEGEGSEASATIAPLSPTPSPTPSATRVPQCSDGLDNDGDGKTDFDPTGRGDPECRNSNDDDESTP